MSDYEQSSYLTSTPEMPSPEMPGDLTMWKNAMYTLMALLAVSILVNNKMVSSKIKNAMLTKGLHLVGCLSILASIIVFAVLWATRKDDLDDDEDAKNATWGLLALIIVAMLVNGHSCWVLFKPNRNLNNPLPSSEGLYNL